MDHPQERLPERGRDLDPPAMTPGDRYLWTLPMFHANGWTFTWVVTAVGAAHVCVRKIDPVDTFQLMSTESVTMLCAAPTVLIALANAPEELVAWRCPACAW